MLQHLFKIFESKISFKLLFKYPADTWRQNNVVSTSRRRYAVASTLIQRYFKVVCLLGNNDDTDQLFIEKKSYILYLCSHSSILVTPKWVLWQTVNAQMKCSMTRHSSIIYTALSIFREYQPTTKFYLDYNLRPHGHTMDHP